MPSIGTQEYDLLKLILKALEDLNERITRSERIARESLEVQREIFRVEEYAAVVLQQISDDLAPESTPATSAIIAQLGDPMALMTISPGNSPTFGITFQPSNAGPFVATDTVWSVSGDPGASVAQIATDATGLTATLTLTTAVVVGATLTLTSVTTNQAGSTPATVTATDVLTVVPAGTPPPPFVPATAGVIGQLT